MGPKRELKFALEKYWKGDIDDVALVKAANLVEDTAWKLQGDAGIDRISVGDQYFYDAIVSWTDWLGVVPVRFQNAPRGFNRMFGMARGLEGATALSMKKWITSNYHYMVPEMDSSTKIAPDFSYFLQSVQRGVKEVGKERATPVIVGPVTIAYLTKFAGGNIDANRVALIQTLIPIYQDLLKKVVAMGVKEIQIHEAALVFDDCALLPLFKEVYPKVLPSSAVGINMVCFMEDVGESHYQWLTSVKGFTTVSMDFTRGNTLALVRKFGFPATKTLGAGLIDSRGVWRVNPSVTKPIIDELKQLVKKIQVQPSGSLQYNPWDLSCESEILKHPAGPVLAFATQKLEDIKIVAKAFDDDSALKSHVESWKNYKTAVCGNKLVSVRMEKLTDKDFTRLEDFDTRRVRQLKGVPLMPTTTIGSFPQTKAIRKLRTQRKKGLLSESEYNAAIDQQIAYAIGMQEALGLDILVHGEAERTDMVEFFAQKMDGMLFTTNGWVQSFGSRCVRPPIFWSDISRPEAMTTREFSVAQALTDKPVKGMLTGPVTILNWSFPRVDIPRKEQCMQIALAIRDEIDDLEKAGCKVIQVDEPALREAMPLRGESKKEYLDWAVNAFRLSTAGALNETQIHTHMCYCEFDDCMEAIDKLDTDVNSIENARSDNATLLSFKRIGYKKGLGPGTYDIHSPVCPPCSFIEDKLKSFLECMDVEKLVVNPDCGLKTRTWPETISALQNMVKATNNVRAELGLVK